MCITCAYKKSIYNFSGSNIHAYQKIVFQLILLVPVDEENDSNSRKEFKKKNH